MLRFYGRAVRSAEALPLCFAAGRSVQQTAPVYVATTPSMSARHFCNNTSCSRFAVL